MKLERLTLMDMCMSGLNSSEVNVNLILGHFFLEKAKQLHQALRNSNLVTLQLDDCLHLSS